MRVDTQSFPRSSPITPQFIYGPTQYHVWAINVQWWSFSWMSVSRLSIFFQVKKRITRAYQGHLRTRFHGMGNGIPSPLITPPLKEQDRRTKKCEGWSVLRFFSIHFSLEFKVYWTRNKRKNGVPWEQYTEGVIIFYTSLITLFFLSRLWIKMCAI